MSERIIEIRSLCIEPEYVIDYSDYERRIRIIEERGREIELRYNHNHDEKGRFCSGVGVGRAPVRNDIDNSGGSGIIKTRGNGKGSQRIKHTYEKIGDIDYNDKKAVAKCLQEFEQKYESSNKEHCRVICKSGEVYEVHGDIDTVDTSLLGDKMNGSINEHNHVKGESQYSFSWEDVCSSAEDGTKTALAFDEKYRYSMTFPNEKLNQDKVYDAYKKLNYLF